MKSDQLQAALAKMQSGIDAIAREQAAMREEMGGRFDALETGMNRRFDFLASQLLAMHKPTVDDIPGETAADKLLYVLTHHYPTREKP